MKTYNKIVIASDIFERAHSQFMSAKSEMDYASSLLLSGAVVGIIAPLLEDQGGHPTHELLARIGNAISEEGDETQKAGLYRAAYNSLKHAGNTRRKISASEDLEFQTDLRIEAARMLDAAKSDFREVIVPKETQAQLSKAFFALLESEYEYA